MAGITGKITKDITKALAPVIRKEAKTLAETLKIPIEEATEQVVKKYGGMDNPYIFSAGVKEGKKLAKESTVEKSLVPVGPVRDESGMRMVPPGYEAFPKEGGGFYAVKPVQEKGAAVSPYTREAESAAAVEQAQKSEQRARLDETLRRSKEARESSEFENLAIKEARPTQFQSASVVEYQGQPRRVVERIPGVAGREDEYILSGGEGGNIVAKRKDIMPLQSYKPEPIIAPEVSAPKKTEPAEMSKEITPTDSFAQRLRKSAVVPAAAAGTSLAMSGPAARSKNDVVTEWFGPPEELPNKSTEELKSGSESAIKELDKITASVEDTKAKAGKAAAPAKTEKEKTAEDKFADLRARAYDLYERAETRNQWLELAQLLAQAFTQYGAAQIGMRTGRPMTGIQVPGIDYGARTEQAGRTLERTLRDISGQEESQQRKLEKAEERRQWEKEYELKKKESEGKVGKEERKEEERTLQDALKQAQEKETDALAVANLLVSQDDLSDKTVKKLEEKLPGLAAKAGIQTESIQQLIKDATTGQYWKTLDKDLKNKLVKERILDPVIASKNNIQAKLDALRSRQKGQAAPATSTETPSTSTQKTEPPLKVGEIKDGYKYLGGDPADPKSWEEVK